MSNVIGEYELLELVGRGGMAQVFRARHKKSGEIYALKILFGAAVLDEKLGLRFRREAEVLKTISHPSVVKLVDFGTAADGRRYLVMEWVEGRQLSEVISREAPLGPSRAADITRKIAAGLGAIHAHELVHRDVKPQNVMLSGEAVKIVDFGLVSGDVAMWERLTRTGEIVGTPLYMAPESIEGSAVDARTDLYSLGVILYEMLSGEAPFSDLSIPELLDKHLTSRPRPLPNLGGIERLAMWLLEKNPLRRPRDARALVAAIDGLELATGPLLLAFATDARTPVTRSGLGETVELHAHERTADGPLTQPYPIQTWTGPVVGGDAEASGSSGTLHSAPDETIRIPIGRTDTHIEDSADSTVAIDEPTAALNLPSPNARTVSIAGIEDTPPAAAPAPPAPASAPKRPQAPWWIRRRGLLMRVGFFVAGLIAASALMYWLEASKKPIEIPVRPSPRAVSRTSTIVH